MGKNVEGFGVEGGPKKEKLRFLFVSSDNFPPFRVDVAVLFGKKLVSRGHAIDFVLQSEGPCRKAYHAQWSGCGVFVGPTDLGTTLRARTRKNLMRIFHELKSLKLLFKKDYDFLLMKDLFLTAFLGLLCSRITGKKYIYWLSYPFPEASLFEVEQGVARYPLIYWLRGHLIAFFLYQLILPCADHIFVQSQQMLKDIAEKSIPVDKMTAVPMGVDSQEIPLFGYHENSRSESPEKIIAYLGTLLKVRHIDFLVRVLQMVLKDFSAVKLLLIGGGDDSDEALIREEARRLGIDDAVDITGFLPQKDAWELLRKADVCVSPFYPTPILNSTSPTKLIEYMAMGKAVVANDHPEQRRVLSESGGGLCVPYDEEPFSRAILYLLSHPREAREMGGRGRAYVERQRDYEVIADQVHRQFWKVMSRQN